MSHWPESLVLVGAGKMGGAMLEGWLAGGLPAKAVTVLDPHPSDAMTALCMARGCALNPALILPPDVLLLAIKPQMLEAAAPMLQEITSPDTLLVSVLAGKTIANLAERIPEPAAMIRTIPNTPAAVHRGITAAFANAGVGARQKAMAHHLLTAIGDVVWVEDEGLIDAATAVSGSGPAYVFLIAEAMTEAGISAGLPREVAAALARRTVEGAGELMFRSPDIDPATLRQNVTSPNGTTAAALSVLMAKDGLQPLMTKAIAAAKRRAEELSG
jgi:pyrroline-5-carboxylate reductase